MDNYESALDPPPEISALLNVATEGEFEKRDLLYHKVPIVDMQPIPPEQMHEALEWIKEHIINHTIMVFCNAGIGRSPSIVMGYLCCELGYGFGQAIEFVARRKPHGSTLPDLIKNHRKGKQAIQEKSEYGGVIDERNERTGTGHCFPGSDNGPGYLFSKEQNIADGLPTGDLHGSRPGR